MVPRQAERMKTMGIHLPATLQSLIERLSEPVHGLLQGSNAAAPDDYEMLWNCYRSGQMSDADLEDEITADPGFAQFMRSREPIFH
jgi:hypothetical protein